LCSSMMNQMLVHHLSIAFYHSYRKESKVPNSLTHTKESCCNSHVVTCGTHCTLLLWHTLHTLVVADILTNVPTTKHLF
jgi:hypothetical protein